MQEKMWSKGEMIERLPSAYLTVKDQGSRGNTEGFPSGGMA